MKLHLTAYQFTIALGVAIVGFSTSAYMVGRRDAEASRDVQSVNLVYDPHRRLLILDVNDKTNQWNASIGISDGAPRVIDGHNAVIALTPPQPTDSLADVTFSNGCIIKVSRNK